MDFTRLVGRQDLSGTDGTGANTDVSTGNSGADEFLRLIADPFQSQIQTDAFYTALAWSIGGGAALFCLFCILRPRVDWIYAPRAKHADAKHAPPAVGNGFFGWWPTLKAVKEQELVEKIGLDAVIFLRFLKMCRNIFLVLTVIGCGVLIPVNLFAPYVKLSSGGDFSDVYVFIRLTPQFIQGNAFWAYVILMYVFNLVIYFFLWRSYRAVTKLRRTYFDSADYRSSLHSRTLLITHLPASSRTEQGTVQLVQEAKPIEDTPKVSIARNVKELPELIDEHEETVKDLESVLAKYLADPNKLPAQRPTCKPSKHDKGRSHSQKVDAIDYLTDRIRELELEINETRQTVDQRHPLPYGFASYTQIEDAHATAYATRKSSKKGTTIKLAPKPHDLIWRNLPMSNAARRTQTFWNGFWMILLTIAYIPPNVLTAVFLANLHNLGQVWPSFNRSLQANPTGWAIAQGIVAPLIQISFYFFLPAIFRKLLIRSGDNTKTQRERHVTTKLYGFFVFNNLFVFSVFASAWAFIATVINAQQQNVWDAIKQGHLAHTVTLGLCNISPYWVTWQSQRTLSAAIDIAQAWPLVSNFFLRKFTNPTPRQMVELTAPQPFDYADYYNNYLFVLTVGLVMGTLQPLLLPITALYLVVDAWFKKYMLQYIFITKVESGGAFWRTIFNRILFAVLLMNLTVALVVGAQGFWNPMLFVMVPLLPIEAAFKYYCSWAFDTQFNYYTTKTFVEGELAGPDTGLPTSERKVGKRSGDRVGVKFGHPALYKKLTTPMVHAKSQHLLAQIYRGRLDSEDADYEAGGKYAGTGSRPTSVFGYSDIYMNEMASNDPGKPKHGKKKKEQFEIVNSSQLDFENFKRRSDFRSEFGGDGELYGKPEDQISRPGTPSSMMSFGAGSTLMGSAERNEYSKDYKTRGRSESPLRQFAGDSTGYNTRESSRTRLGAGDGDEHTYPRGYANANISRGESPVRHELYAPQPRTRTESPSIGRHLQPTPPLLDNIDLPTPGLDRHGIQEAGLEAYRDDDTLSTYQERRLSQGSLGGMLQNAQGMGRSPSPAAPSGQTRGRLGRKPLPGQATRPESGSGFGAPPAPMVVGRFTSQSPSGDIGGRGRTPGYERRRQSPGAASGLGRYAYTDGSGVAGTGEGGQDEATSYDYFRRGRTGR